MSVKLPSDHEDRPLQDPFLLVGLDDAGHRPTRSRYGSADPGVLPPVPTLGRVGVLEGYREHVGAMRPNDVGRHLGHPTFAVVRPWRAAAPQIVSTWIESYS